MYQMQKDRGPLNQLEDYPAHNRTVVGSSPTRPTTFGEYMKCPHCENGTLILVEECDVYSPDFYICDTCDSTFPVK